MTDSTLREVQKAVRHALRSFDLDSDVRRWISTEVTHELDSRGLIRRPERDS